MNKKILLIIGVVAIILVGLFVFKLNNKKETVLDVKTGGVFNSIKDALNNNLSLTCEFKTPEGESTKSYIKNGAVRVSSAGPKQAGEIIILKDKMYMWDIKTKEGFVYPIRKEDQADKVGMTGSEAVQSDSYLNMIDQYKDSCKIAVVDDSLFTAPLDVKFQDMGKFLEDLQKQMPSIPSQQ